MKNKHKKTALYCSNIKRFFVLHRHNDFSSSWRSECMALCLAIRCGHLPEPQVAWPVYHLNRLPQKSLNTNPRKFFRNDEQLYLPVLYLCVPYYKYLLLKKLLAIFLIIALYAPHIARLVMYTECTLQATSMQQCDCNIANIPDWQTSFPEKQKDIQHETDWKYLLTEKPLLTAATAADTKYSNGRNANTYSFTFINSIFHPPGCAVNIT